MDFLYFYPNIGTPNNFGILLFIITEQSNFVQIINPKVYKVNLITKEVLFIKGCILLFPFIKEDHILFS